MNPAQFRAYLARRVKSESQAKIAADLGVTQQAVSLWLQGKRPPSPSILRLAELLKSTPNAA